MSAAGNENSLNIKGSISPILDSYEAYGCKVNGISVDELFRRYKEAGFLYPAKMLRLAPFMQQVIENWRKVLTLGEDLAWFITIENAEDSSWASVASWRSTITGWNSQHVVSIGGPHASRAVLLAGAAVRVRKNREGVDNYQQNWFRPANRFANKVFGSLVESIGSEASWVGTYQYLSVKPNSLSNIDEAFLGAEYAIAARTELQQFIQSVRGRVFLCGEELDNDDIGLDALDQLYGRVGLRRYRRVFLTRRHSTGDLVGVALAYRAPLGLNFSFLENRCDLIIHPNLTDIEAGQCATALLHQAAPVYADFEPRSLPVVTDVKTGTALVQHGAEFIREYAQSVWLPEGYVGWYRHVEAFYDRVLKAEHRRGLARRKLEANGG